MASIPPSQICLLSDLPSKRPGDKVRFLGCVTAYDTATGVLGLQHEHPSATRVRALVDVDLVRERLTAELVQVGAWVNVIAYVAAVPAAAPARKPQAAESAAAPADVHLQALLLWSAGPLNLQSYERQLAEMLRAG